jgi:uncharacterized protein (TIGR03437 family)
MAAVFRIALALAAVLCAGTARGAGPSYSAAGIVNASSFIAGPFAPNSVISIFGAGLARSTYALQASDIKAGALPLELNFVRVYVQDQPAPMLFVSEGQINFVMPGIQLPGAVRVRVVVEGTTGPEISLTLAASAPALFPLANSYIIATSVDNKLLTADAPAHANDTVVIYCTGLGPTSPNPPLGAIPSAPAVITSLTDLKISLNNTPLDPVRIKYAGVTPGSAGLYQINLVLPDGAAPDPEIRVWSGSQSPQPGLKLAVR